MKCASLTCAGSSVVIPQRYLNDCDANEIQSACYTGLAIARCDWVPTDVTDTAEIEAAVLAGKIKLLPKGKIVLETPSDVVEEDYSGCFDRVVVRTERLVNYETWLFKADHSDEDYWTEVCELFQNQRVTLILIKSDGYFTLGNEWADLIKGGYIGTEPDHALGLEASLTQNFSVDRGDAKGKARWKAQFQLNYNCVLQHVTVPGFVDALADSESAS